MSPRAGTTYEPLLNRALAQLLRQHGLEAEAEQTITDVDGRLHRVDVLVEFEDQSAAIEAEFARARTVRQDAFKRMPETPLIWRELPAKHVFAVVYPQNLRHLPESAAARELATCQELEFTRVPRPADQHIAPGQIAGPSQQAPETRQTGPVAAIAECLRDFWVQTANGSSVEETVTKAARAIDYASELLRNRVPGPESGGDSDPAATHALIWLNALLFQELLSAHLDTKTLSPAHRRKKIPVPDPRGRPSVIFQQWERLLEINWWPIFSVALESLAKAPSDWTGIALPPLRNAAATIAESGVIRRHDIAGRIFHRLLDSRKFLATNYTTIPAAVLLAGLALDPRHRLWKNVAWSSPEAVARLRIVDPACGSGTLLMAVVQEVLKRHRRAGGDEESRGAIVKVLLERALHGVDVVPAAVHLTATTLSMAETRQAIEDMPVYWMPHDVSQGRTRLGSLDFLASSRSAVHAALSKPRVRPRSDYWDRRTRSRCVHAGAVRLVHRQSAVYASWRAR